MTTLLLNSFLALVVMLFAVMAYYPLFLKNEDAEAPVESYGEDVVVSVSPAPIGENAPVQIGHAGRYSTRDGEKPEHPGHIPAA